jgi:glutathionylspermidine synthase
MERLPMPPRPDWVELAEAMGFDYHTLHGEPYWTDDAAYAFSLAEIERDIEAPSAELWAMALDFADRAVRDEEILQSLAIPEPWWPTVAQSWARHDRDLYGRFDFIYDGSGPARLLEFNADTPTSLFEAAVFQWVWLEQALEQRRIPSGSDQFNSLHESLIDAFLSLDPGYGPLAGVGLGGRMLHFTCVADCPEDYGNTVYLRDCADQAGLRTGLVFIEEIGVDAEQRLTDLEDRVIEALFKLYPWEFLIAEPYGRHLQAPNAPLMIEPAWKMLLSNKGLLPWLWRLHPHHPNLLPARFLTDDAPPADRRLVVKPLLSREGANVGFVDPGRPLAEGRAEGPYGAEGWIVQDYSPLPVFADRNRQACHAVVGSWIIAGRPCGLGMREDSGPVTTNTARFVPHLIRP